MVQQRAQEENIPGSLSNYVVAPGLPVPNLLTSLYDRLGVPSWRTRHARALAGLSVSSMRLVTNFDGPRQDAVSLEYLRQGAESTSPDARITFFEGTTNVLLQAYGPLKSKADISEMPGVHEILISDVTFAARAILRVGNVQQ